MTLEDFVRDHDRELFGEQSTGSVSAGRLSLLRRTSPQIKLKINNSFDSVAKFHYHLDSLDITNTDRLRPRWDAYFMVWMLFYIIDWCIQTTSDARRPCFTTFQLYETPCRSNTRARKPYRCNRVRPILRLLAAFPSPRFPAITELLAASKIAMTVFMFPLTTVVC